MVGCRYGKKSRGSFIHLTHTLSIYPPVHFARSASVHSHTLSRKKDPLATYLSTCLSPVCWSAVIHMLTLTPFYLCFLESPKKKRFPSPILSRYGFVLSFLSPSCSYHLLLSLSLLYRIGWDGWVGFYHFLISSSSATTKTFLSTFLFLQKFNSTHSNSIPQQFFVARVHLFSHFLFFIYILLLQPISFAIGLWGGGMVLL